MTLAANTMSFDAQRLNELCAELQAENAKLRAALGWYADRENYETGQDAPDVLIDGGAYAKRALTHEQEPTKL
jgi:hypothetical protein